MRFLNILFGRSKPVKSRPDRLFAISTAEITMSSRYGIIPSGTAGVCFRPISSSFFAEAERELREMLDLGAKQTESRIRVTSDNYGFQWVIAEDKDFSDLVNTIYTVSLTLQEHGFEDQLLAAVFKFEEEGRRTVYLIYNYKRAQYYPFVPVGNSQERDNATELRLKGSLQKELPIDSDLERWYALWGVPL